MTFTDSDSFDIEGGEVGDTVSIDVSTGVAGGDGRYAYSANGLPAGIEINGATGLISGAFTEPTDGGVATITVTDGAGASESITIAIGEIIDSI